MSDINLDDVLLDAEEFKKQLPNEEKLETLASLGNALLDYQVKIAELEAKVDELKNLARDISEVKLPELMDEIGLSEFRLAKKDNNPGMVVRVKPFYSGKITDENAYKWLDDNNHGDIIKGAVTVDYPKGFDKQKLAMIAQAAKAAGLPANIREEVHHSTLRAWLKEMVETGQEFPRDLFNCYVGKRASLSLK